MNIKTEELLKKLKNKNTSFMDYLDDKTKKLHITTVLFICLLFLCFIIIPFFIFLIPALIFVILCTPFLYVDYLVKKRLNDK